jgi:hypothetical protein
MKQPSSFFTSLEHYTHKVLSRSPIPYSYVGIAFIGLLLVVSLFQKRDSLAHVESTEQAIRVAAQSGDYLLAEELYTRHDSTVLGANTELERLIYPERVIEERITKVEENSLIYPENRQMYLLLSELYLQSGNQELASDYAERARILAPNN